MSFPSAPAVGRITCTNTILTGDRLAPPPKGCVTHQLHVEVNLIKSGLLTYICGGNETQAGAGRLVAFWSAIPHQIAERSHDAEYYAMTIPLTWFLQHSLPEGFTRLILDGQVLVDPQICSKGDGEMFEQWIEDLRLGQPACERIVMLEVEARLLRFAEDLAEYSPSLKSRLKATAVCDQNGADRIRQMLAFIALNYTDKITVELIGKSAGLAPNYAMNLFRKTVGTTLGSYVTRLRVSRAQQLLATSDDKVVDVALSAGFNSLSRFYDVFKKVCGSSPRDYRERYRRFGLN